MTPHFNDCFSCKYTHYSKAIHNNHGIYQKCYHTVSAANIHIIRKQFTTDVLVTEKGVTLFQLQIYTLFESNSQLKKLLFVFFAHCFSCKYTHYSKAIHNKIPTSVPTLKTVSAANIHIIRKQFTTRSEAFSTNCLLFQLQIYTLFESNSQQ